MITIKEIKEKALKEEVPIIDDEGLEFLLSFIQQHNIKNILEIGSAVGYSAIMMASCSQDIQITTIEKDFTRAIQAKRNIEELGLNNQIELLYEDALTFKATKQYDFLFIDAAKTKNEEFFNLFTPFLRKGGYVFIDDIWFHGFTDDISQVRTRRLRELVVKIQKFKEMVMNNPAYEATYYENGDGIIVAKKL